MFQSFMLPVGYYRPQGRLALSISTELAEQPNNLARNDVERGPVFVMVAQLAGVAPPAAAARLEQIGQIRKCSSTRSGGSSVMRNRGI